MTLETLERLVTSFGPAGPGQVGPPPEAGVGVFEPLEASLALVVGLLVATATIAVSAGYLRDDRALGTALVTALLGALLTGLVGWLIEPALVAVPLALAAWVAVLRFQYGGDWTDAAAVGVGAWALAVVVAALFALVGVPISVVGVPGV